MKRRQVLQALGSSALSLSLAARLATAAEQGLRKILFFSRSVLFEHSVVRREGSRLSFAERIFTEWGAQAGLTVECSKDGRVFDGDLDQYAAIISYTCGTGADMLKPQSKDGTPPISEQGLKRIQDAVSGGKPLVAIHPGFLMFADAVGTGYIGHGLPQEATQRIVSPHFPGVQGLGESLVLTEEWFSLVDFAKDLHVVLVQETQGMRTEHPSDKKCYSRPPYPATWARQHGKTRAFYTSLGHREDVWTNSVFKNIVMGGLAWAMGDVQADVTPNIDQVAPRANDRTN